MKKLFFFLACLLATVSFSSQFQLDSLKNQYQINDALYIEKDRSIKLLNKELDSLIGQNKELLKSLEKSKLELEIAKSEYQPRNDWINKVFKSKKNEINLLQNEVDSSFIFLANYYEDDLGIYLYNSLKSKNISVIISSNAKKTSNYLKNQMKSNLQLLNKNLDLVDKGYKFIITDDNIIGYRPDINFNKLKILRIDTLPISFINNQKFLKHVKKYDPFMSFNTLSFLKEATGLDSNYFIFKEKRKFNVMEIEQLKYDIEKLKTQNNDLLNDYLEKTSPITQKIKSLEYKIETIRNRSGSLHLSLKSDSSIIKDAAHNLKLIQKLIPKEKKLYENYLIKNKKKYYYDNNQLKSVGCKIINTPIGYWKYYYDNGKLKSKGSYNLKGIKIGKWYYYFVDGILEIKEQYDNEGRLNKIGKWVNNWKSGVEHSKIIEINFKEYNKGSDIVVYKENKLFLEAEFIHQYYPLTFHEVYEETYYYRLSSLGGLLWNLQHAVESDFNHWVGYDSYKNQMNVSRSYINNIFHGKCVQYDLNGRKHSEFIIESNNTYPNDVIFNKNNEVSYYSFCGSYSSYYPNGRVKEKGNYISNLKVGNWKTYHENGRLNSIGNYSIINTVKDGYHIAKDVNSVKSGKWEYYNKYGKLMNEKIYKEYPDAVFNEFKKKNLKDNSTNKAHKRPTKSLVLNKKDIDQKKINSVKEEPEPVDEQIFDVVEKNPEFIGGMSKLYEFLGKNIQYPEMAKENEIQGKVFVQFVVWKDGTIKDVRVVKGVHKTLDSEAKRVIEIMPKWIPAMQNGKFVNSKFTLPILFRIS